MTHACPHCGKESWSYRSVFLSKNQKELIEVSYCDKCTWRFIERYKLHPVDRHGHLVNIEKHPSTYNLFTSEKLKEGKGFVEIAKLWKEQKELQK